MDREEENLKEKYNFEYYNNSNNLIQNNNYYFIFLMIIIKDKLNINALNTKIVPWKIEENGL